MAREVVKWEPFGEVSRLRREMDRFWEEFFGPGPLWRRGGEEWSPAVDVAETPEKLTVKAEIPGIEPNNLAISLVGDLLTIRGEKKSEREETKENYHLVERSHGSFCRALRLPAAVDAGKIEAQYEKGVLTITCPKKEVVKPKAIAIKTQKIETPAKAAKPTKPKKATKAPKAAKAPRARKETKITKKP